jgi:hypothetical protein
MAWRVARSLLVLRTQVDALYPGRARDADGTIGDAEHAASASDHNPDAYGVVRALDVTHDPAHGADMARLAEALRWSTDPRIKYVIFNRRIFSATVSPWTWRTYSGSDPHTGHLHLSIVDDERADDPRPWSIGAADARAELEDEMMLLKDKTGSTIVLTDWRVTLTPSMADVTALRAGGVTYAEVSAGAVTAALALPRPGAVQPVAVTMTDAQAAMVGDRIGAALAGRAGLTRAEVAGAVRDALRIAP